MKAILLLALCLLAGCASRAQVNHGLVILISIDAFRPDYLQRGLTPNLKWLADHGVRARWMIPSFPTETYPNHYAMVTGLYPDHNGVVGNAIEADGMRALFTSRQGSGEEEWFEQATPIWVLVQQAGGHSAVMLWPGSEAPNHGIRPDHWLPYGFTITANDRVDRLLKWLDGKPNLAALYFDQVDYQGHLHGPDSQEVNDAIRNTDAAIGRLIDGLKARGMFNSADIIIVSDHGMASLKHILYLDDYTTSHVVMTGGVAGIAGPQPKLPHAKCWAKDNIPARFQYGTNPRIPQTICLAEDGWKLTTHADVDDYLGEHGYDNADPNMRAIFIAEGPDFRKGYVAPSFPNVDVYVLLTYLLGVPPGANDGSLSAVEPMLAP